MAEKKTARDIDPTTAIPPRPELCSRCRTGHDIGTSCPEPEAATLERAALEAERMARGIAGAFDQGFPREAHIEANARISALVDLAAKIRALPLIRSTK